MKGMAVNRSYSFVCLIPSICSAKKALTSPPRRMTSQIPTRMPTPQGRFQNSTVTRLWHLPSALQALQTCPALTSLASGCVGSPSTPGRHMRLCCVRPRPPAFSRRPGPSAGRCPRPPPRGGKSPAKPSAANAQTRFTRQTSGSRPKKFGSGFSEAVVVIEAGRILVDRGPGRRFWGVGCSGVAGFGRTGIGAACIGPWVAKPWPGAAGRVTCAPAGPIAARKPAATRHDVVLSIGIPPDANSYFYGNPRSTPALECFALTQKRPACAFGE
jgi:hypothetical protein